MGLICRNFEWSNIADGHWFKMSETERRRLHLKPYIVNNNYYFDIPNKIARQTLAGKFLLALF